MAKQEVEYSQEDLLLLHMAADHVLGNGLTELHTALMEAAQFLQEIDSERVKELVRVVATAVKGLEEGLKPLLETIPGVKVPTADELYKMLVDVKAEEEFLSLIKSDENLTLQ